MRTIATALLLLASPVASAHAHGSIAEPAWTFDPWILLPLIALAVTYGIGVARVWRKVGTGRGVQRAQVLSYALGWFALFVALISPLHWLGERLFTFHMFEHEIVMAIAAPLIATSRPRGAMVWGLPERWRRMAQRVYVQRHLRTLWDWLGRGVTATVLHGAAIWFWHAPALFDAAVVHVGVHRIQHLTFFVTGVMFWGAVLRSRDFGLAAFHLFLTMLHTSVLGALMALSPRVLYVAQTAAAADWGLTPLEDQQLAGIVMWIPAGTVYAGGALLCAALWINRSSEAVGSHVREAV